MASSDKIFFDTFTAAVETLPLELQPLVLQYGRRYSDVVAQEGLQPISDEKALQDLVRVWAASDFVAEWCLHHPYQLNCFIKEEFFLKSCSLDQYRERLIGVLRDIESEANLIIALRKFRNEEMVRIAWRDLLGLDTLADTMLSLSGLAEVCVQESLACLNRWHVAEWGQPIDSEGRPQSLLVIAMGKLGGWELNFSSDIDLIFAYPQAGIIEKSQLDHQQFFMRLGQRLVNILSKVTSDGFVFRVDMRLRPHGDSGALVINLDAMSIYYREQASQWERYALIKARVICGDAWAIDQLDDLLQEFVYQKYIDFSVMSTLRKIQARIAEKQKGKAFLEDVKRGAGGIREIEFIGQTFQLIRGGRVLKLQVRPILEVLQVLERDRLLSMETVDRLSSAYIYLRRLENRLQMLNDHQTHQLPSEKLKQARIAFSMGYAQWDMLWNALHKHMDFVHQCFQALIEKPAYTSVKDEQLLKLAKDFWRKQLTKEDEEKGVALLGYAPTEETRSLVDQFRSGKASQSLMSIPQTANVFDTFMPILLIYSAKTSLSSLDRLLDLVEKMSTYPHYFVLLLENPRAIERLVSLFDRSAIISDQIIRNPELLNELLNEESLYKPVQAKALTQQIDREMACIAIENSEEKMNCLRRFKQAQFFKIVVADVINELPLMRVSDYLTALAVIMVKQVFRMAWDEMVFYHGLPSGMASEDPIPFGVIAYGKLGGIELGYASDLDLVFVYDVPEQGMTQGEKSLSNEVFFNRLGQRIIHLLSQSTAEGKLYDVDTRLRPSGQSGLLVSRFSAYTDYQHQSAWTWEYQALIRAWMIVGSPHLLSAFDLLRESVLTKDVDLKKLKTDVVDMRARMREQTLQTEGRPPKGYFDLKSSIGGITDIEFIVQYLALKYANQHREILSYTDNIRLLDQLSQWHCISEAEGKLLADAYRHYRQYAHKASLNGEAGVVPVEEMGDYPSHVEAIWSRLFGVRSIV